MSEIWKRDEVESPCVQICVMHPDSKLCMGCARTLDEIARWSVMDNEARRVVLADLPTRDAMPKRKRTKRRN